MDPTTYNALTYFLLSGAVVVLLISAGYLVAAVVGWRGPYRKRRLARFAAFAIAFPLMVAAQQALLYLVFLPTLGLEGLRAVQKRKDAASFTQVDIMVGIAMKALVVLAIAAALAALVCFVLAIFTTRHRRRWLWAALIAFLTYWAGVGADYALFYFVYMQPHARDRITEDFTDQQPLGERLRGRARDARLGHQRVLIVALALGGDFSRQFFAMYYDLEQRDIYDQLGDFRILLVDTAENDRKKEGQELSNRLGFTWPESDDATLAVLGEDGSLVGQVSCKKIVRSGSLDRHKLSTFLREHAPELPDAEKLLADALAGARRDQKRVFVQESGPYCKPCLLLARFLDEHHDLIAKDYVYVELESRFGHGDAVIERLHSSTDGDVSTDDGIPWMLILDAEGKPLISSNGPHGNIGYPSAAEEREHFEKMLRTTAQNLSGEDLQLLIDALAKERS